MDLERHRSRQKLASKDDNISKYHFPDGDESSRNKSFSKQMRRRQSSDESDTKESQKARIDFAQKRSKFENKRETDESKYPEKKLQLTQGKNICNSSFIEVNK